MWPFKRTPAVAEIIQNDTWILARVDEQPRSYQPCTECHAGQVKFYNGDGGYAVRFHFGVRWISHGDFDVVGRDVATYVDPAGVDTIAMGTLLRLGKVRDV